MLVLLAALLVSPLAPAFTVKQFHPTGHVRGPRQIRAVFSEAMVPFGDTKGLEPFDVSCSTQGKGLWEDARTWIYEFEKELPAGESCALKGKKELKSQKGSAWTGKTEFAFGTGGPAVMHTDPYAGNSLEQKPAFLLYLDGEVDKGSVEKNAYLLVEGLQERVPVEVLSDKLRDRILKRPGGYIWQGSEGEEAEESEGAKKPVATIAIESSRNLPPDVNVRLVWGKGIRSPKGPATDQDQLLSFRTEKDFTATFSCLRENEKSACLPISDMSLDFNAPVARKKAEGCLLRFGKTVVRPKIEGKEENVSFLKFPGPFPPNASFTVEIPSGVEDDRGRKLSNGGKFPLASQTAGYPPLAKFAAAFGIYEATNPVLPLTLRAVEPKLAGWKLEGTKVKLGAADPVAVMNWVFKLKDRQQNYFTWKGDKTVDLRDQPLLANQGGVKFDLPKPGGSAAFEVVGVPLKEKGFHVVEIGSQLLGKSLIGKPSTMYVASGALVTNLAVHLKWGPEGSLVWVTALDSGKPVKGALLKAVDCSGKVVWTGTSDANGTAVATLGEARECNPQSTERFTDGLMVVAEKEGDFSFVHSNWDDGIESWRFQLPTGEPEADENMAHTVLDRTLYRAGQTAHMKHFLRERFLRGIRYARRLMPKNLVVLHSNGRKVVIPVKFNGAGVAESEWKIPKEAELGGYTLYLTGQSEKEAKGRDGEEDGFRSWGKGVYESGQFRVEEFRLPVLAGSLQWPEGHLVGASTVKADLNIRYLAGGGAAGLAVKLRGRANRLEATSFPAFEGYTFANGGVKTGRVARSETQANEEKIFPDQQIVLDGGGSARAEVKGLPDWDQPARISLEAEYRDPNGEAHAIGRSTVNYPASVLVGIRPDSWLAEKDKAKFRVAVVSPDGKPVSGKAVKVRWYERQEFSHRKRIVGGFYAYENFEEIDEKGEACSGKTDNNGILRCESKAPGPGNMLLAAEVSEGGNKSRAHQDIFIAGADEWWFSQGNDDRIDLVPEKKSYEPGENARFQLRSPFRTATALITVEREGVVDRYVREVSGKDPVVELPMKASYAPNVFASALLVRGRVGEPQATALVDLARPAHKLGIAEVTVGWKAHRLNVEVATDKAEYRIREKAKVKVKVSRAIDGKPADKGEVLLVAVDEALLELLPNKSWDLLEAMMGRRSLKVRTSTAQSQVVGKRHFGQKALPPGGGGGRSSSLRESFDSLLFWKATLPLNAKGEAVAEIPLNDSLSSFRIVAVASEAADRFGTGSHAVSARQDLMLFSGVSPLGRQGDKFLTEVTVRNASGRKLESELRGRAGSTDLPAQKISLAPGESKAVFWPFTLPMEGESLPYEFSASAGGESDALKVTQKLEPALRESVVQATLERLEGKLAIPVAIAKDALPGRGGVTVKAEKTLAANLDPVRRYMKEYPFDCLEQKVSQAVALRNPKLWKGIVSSLSYYTDGDGLLKYFPEMHEGDDALTAYVLSVAQEAGYSFPEPALQKLIGGLKKFVLGKNSPGGFRYPAADLAIRKLAAMEALSRYQSFSSEMLSLLQLEPTLWPMKALLDWYGLLNREQEIPNRVKLLTQAEQQLRARLEWRGTAVAFKGELPLWWLMSSEDESSVRLLLAAAAGEHWKDDIGRLVRGVLARQRYGRWDLTTANAWGVLAMERFSAKHEKEAVSGLTSATLDGKTQTVDWSKPARAMDFPWPKAKSELKLTHQGQGKPWALLEARAAIRLSEPISKGYRLIRTVIPVEQKSKGKWTRGDVYRVNLKIEAMGDMTWVAVSDPIPAGAAILGSGLGGDSSSLTRGEKGNWGATLERGFSGLRAFFPWMPKGSHELEYTVRLNTSGNFQLPNSRVEAMYAPESYAELPNDALTVL